MVSTWYGGRNPGLLTIALSALAAAYFIIPPLHSLVPSLLNLPEISTFILVSLLINFLTAARQHSEKSLRQSKESYRIIAETASDAIITIDESSTILFVNQAAEKIFGYSIKEMLGQSLTMLMPDYLREVHRAGLSRYLTTREKHLSWSSIELPGLHKSGWEIPLELSFGELIRDGQHRFTGIVRDISRRKRADEALKASESELRALFAAMTDVILVLDEEGRYLKIAPTDPAYLYKPSDDLIGKKLHEVFPKEEADFFLAHIRRALDEGQMHRVEYRLEIEEKEVWFDGSVSPLSKDSVVWIARDITERKRAEEALHGSEERYRLLFESNPHPMWVYDLETLRFLTVNEAAIHHYGYTREEFLSLTISDIRPKEDVSALLENVSKVNGTLDTAGGWRHLKKDASLIDVEVVSHGLIFDGRPAELVLVSDVTGRKRTEEALREADHKSRSRRMRWLVRFARYSMRPAEWISR